MRIPYTTSRRRGVVLLVVMAMLALFAALGISFVFYADAVAVASTAHRQAQAKEQAYLDPELLSSYFLNQFINGTNNPYSSMQGHGLADTIYGYNPTMLNTTPYNGPGRQAYPVAAAGLNSFDMVQFTKFDTDGFQRRPGFYDVVGAPEHRYIEGTNIPWTAPDRHNMFLGMMTADGTVLLPSFMRPWINPNVDDANPASKSRYLTLRPHGSWHPGFVPGATFGGGFPYLPDSEAITIDGKKIILDVRNNDFGIGFSGPAGVTYNNDSIWMDLGFPIMTAPNGKRYRPLFAPLVIDLSNRLHLWAHGNNIGLNESHVSAKGFGAPEVSLAKVFSDVNDLKKIYAMRGLPGGTPFGLPAFGLHYSRLDLDALDTTTNLSAGPFTLPVKAPAMTTNVFTIFPTFPASGNENNATEIALNKPLGRDIFKVSRPLPMSEMEWLLRYGGTNVPATTSELARQLTASFNDPADPRKRRRNMVTLWSAHLDRIAAPPVISFDPYGATPRYTMGPPDAMTGISPLPKLNPPLTPTVYTPPPGAMSPNSEYGNDWRSTLANRLRVNLNRKLTAYPNQDATTGVFNSAEYGVYNQAVADRQVMAKELYNALVRVTGATDPNHPSASVDAKDPANASYKAARWLAQLAVNMVDYIDEDDYMTPFPWNPNEWIFGTELPRLVVNEFYGQFDTDPDNMVSPECKLNVWLELHNPFYTTPGAITAYPRDKGTAHLVQGGDQTKPIYQIVVCTPESMLDPGEKKLRDAGNNLGDPNPKAVIGTLKDWGAAGPNHQVLPADGLFQETSANKNVGFYVVGAEAKYIAGREPNLPSTFLSPALSIKRPHPVDLVNTVTVVVRRLANPHLPHNDTPGDQYNPFITIDYLADLAIGDNRDKDADGNDLGNVRFPKSFTARGRRQPYAADSNTQIALQSPQEYDPDSPTPQPKHTFFRHNSRSNDPKVPDTNKNLLSFPFDWLVHLDRPLINPLELLHVSGYRPHELTQQFGNANGIHQHVAPWVGTLAQDAMIYRVLDLVTTPNLMAGTYSGGVQPGLINPNTVTEEEILQALGDANNANFTTDDVKKIFSKIVQSRTGNPASVMQPAKDGTPFRGFGAGNRDESWLRFDPENPTSTVDKLFDLGTSTDHPYQRNALLQKIYNNLTPTSNVFAVWWTVGYFEVLDETVRPARLGAEIGRSENRHVRHRFFAIVDRSALKIFSAMTASDAVAGADKTVTFDLASIRATNGPAALWNATFSYTQGNAVTFGGAAYLCLQANTNVQPPNAAVWQPLLLQPGMIVDVGGPNPEAVVVKAATANSFTADFAFTHPAGSPMLLRGNPGPQGNYNPHRDSNVVLHLNVIK
jgi:hypothetical protein